MSRSGDLYAKVSPKLAHGPGSVFATRLHARVVRASRGRLAGRMFGSELLILRTTGRRSGKARESPMMFLEHAGGWAVMASNAASQRTPAWVHNLAADPAAEVVLRGRTHAVLGRRATPEESAALWPRFVAIYRGFDHYRSIATRELPVVVLERA